MPTTRGLGIAYTPDTGVGQGAYVSGHYYFASGTQYNQTTGTLTQSTLRVGPFWVPAPLSISKIGGEVTTVAASSTVRIGIYRDSNFYPGALYYDSGASDGTINGNSQTVQDITCATPVVLERGWWWFGAVSQGGNPTLRVQSAPTSLLPISAGTATPAAGIATFGYTQGSVTGALPANFNAIGSAGFSTNSLLRIHFKVT